MGGILDGIGEFVGNIFGFTQDQAPTTITQVEAPTGIDKTQNKTFSETETKNRRRKLSAAKTGASALRIPLNTSAPKKSGLNTNKTGTGLNI